MNKYAIINSGSKQYKVSVGDIIRIESVDKNKGDEISFNPSMLKNNDDIILGEQALKNANVKGVVVGSGRAKKIIVFKMKRRKDERKKRGHRQNFTDIKITDIP
ncbi:MAG: 50S ribosomal protein L21 [Deltaproteobacteria bacterium]|nr:50S ribosomal protein L21 [Deltaproteobacteria bacterium]